MSEKKSKRSRDAAGDVVQVLVSAAWSVLRLYVRVLSWFLRILVGVEVRLFNWYIHFSVTRVLPWLSCRWAALRARVSGWRKPPKLEADDGREPGAVRSVQAHL